MYKRQVRDTALTRGLLIQQVASGVRWQQSIEAMIADGVDTCLLYTSITPRLGVLSKGILIALMFLGRVGGLTLVYAAMPGRKSAQDRKSTRLNSSH